LWCLSSDYNIAPQQDKLGGGCVAGPQLFEAERINEIIISDFDDL
jgi:hypothetical protein